MFSPFVDLLVLILIANGTPVIARNLLRGHFDQPLDLGYCLPDQQRLLGASKTWRGLITSLAFTSFCATVMGYSINTGFLVALMSLTGDAFSSFIKRRLRRSPSSMFLLLDQIPESLLPALLMAGQFGLSLEQVLWLVLIFIVAELVLSNLMYRLGIRKKPY